MKKGLKGFLGIGSSNRVNNHIRFPSDSHSSSGNQSNRDNNAMPVDQVSQGSGGQQVELRVLTSDEQIILREQQAFQILKDHTFLHTRVYDHDFLNRTGMITEFQNISRTTGWEKFWRIIEEGSRQLVIEFFCTLTTTANHVTFRLFGEQ